MIGAAVLSLLSRYAEEAPVAVVVDDLHLLDLPSAEALVFAARRLAADPVVRAARRPAAPRRTGWSRGSRCCAWLGSTDEAAARARRPRRRRARSRRVGSSRCSRWPRATRWRCSSWPATTSTPSPPTRPSCRRACPTRSRRRSPAGSTCSTSACRTALLVAAVCGGDLLVTTRACSALGVDAEALAGAEDAGLVSVRGGSGDLPAPAGARRVVLPRGGAGAAGRPRGRRRVPARGGRRPPRLAPGRGRLAARRRDLRPARRRGRSGRGPGRRTRSPRVPSSGPPGSPRTRASRAERLLQAAEAAWSAGLTERALGLLDAHARADPPTADAQVRELALRGAIAARTGRLQDAREMLLAAADLSTDPAEECA